MTDAYYRVFISHLAEERPVALLLQRTLKIAFGDLKIFVSSDQGSISTGQPWYDKITAQLCETDVIIVLLSQESCRRPWINFEAGAGVGRRIAVIPLALSRFSASAVPLPIAGLQIRRISEIGSLLESLSNAIEEHPAKIDIEAYGRELAETEAALNYKSLVVTPVVEGTKLFFDIENTGNADIELLMLEFRLPQNVVDGMALSYETHIDRQTQVYAGKPYYWMACYAPRGALSGIAPKIRPVVTRSMGKFRLPFSINILWEQIEKTSRDHLFTYQIHAANYQTVQEQCSFVGLFGRKPGETS